MSATDYEKPEPPVEVFLTDRHAVKRNVATNGRMFSAMVFTVALAAFVIGHGTGFAVLAIGAAIPVGIACIVDQMKPGPAQGYAALLSYVLAAVIPILVLVMLG